MSARQAFVPRPPSRLPSELHPHSTDARTRDGDNDMLINGNGKARSITAFLGQKRGGTDTASQGAGQTRGTGLGRMNTSTSFEGILRPEKIPMSIIPYPATAQPGAGMKQPVAGQTQRKSAGLGVFEFPSPMTQMSMPRGVKKGLVAESGDDEETSNENVHGTGIVFMGPEGETDARISAATGIGGYMRIFEGAGSVGNAGGLQSTSEHDIIAPVPGYAPGGLGPNLENEGCEIDSMFARVSRSLGAMADGEVGSEKNNDSRRSLCGMKRGMRDEDTEESGRWIDEGHQTQGSAKRMRQIQHDPNHQDYVPISSPHIPPTFVLPTSSTGRLDPSLVVDSLLENMEEFVSLEQIDADWKRWRECTTEEWLKGADALAQDYAGLVNMVRDYLKEKVLAYASMISSVEEKRTAVNRNIEVILGKGNIVRENISKLGMKK